MEHMKKLMSVNHTLKEDSTNGFQRIELLRQNCRSAQRAGARALVLNNRPPSWITNQVVGIIEGKTPRWWWVTFIISALVMLLCPIYIGYLITTGVGVWGLNSPIAWGWAIVNFVFWIGIGHADLDLGCVVFAQAEMAHFDQPSGRGHDHFCCDVRRDLSWNTCRPNLVCLVVVSTAQL